MRCVRGPAHDCHLAPGARDSDHDPEELRGAAGEPGGNGRKSIARIGDSSQVERQTAQRVSSPRYASGVDASRKSKCGSRFRIEWVRGVGEPKLTENRSGALERARVPKQTSSTLDRLHASSVAMRAFVTYIVWWLCDANRCCDLPETQGSTVFFSDSSRVRRGSDWKLLRDVGPPLPADPPPANDGREKDVEQQQGSQWIRQGVERVLPHGDVDHDPPNERRRAGDRRPQ